MLAVSKQARNGKAFEYALLLDFKEKLERLVRVQVLDTAAVKQAKGYYNSFAVPEQGAFRTSSSAAVKQIIELEPRLSEEKGGLDLLQLGLASDEAGELGDVRDVLAFRLLQQWDVGVSAKNNHDAVKHSRLSRKADFGKTWLGLECSQEYFDAITPIFDDLAQRRKKSDRKAKWSEMGDYHTSVYKPVLDAFRKELLRLSVIEGVPQKLIRYLVGRKDFYKVIRHKDEVKIKGYNLSGNLNQSGQLKSKKIVPKLTLPTKIKSVEFKEGSKNTLLVKLDNEWEVAMRIHNANSRIEASLKFDVGLDKAPKSLFEITIPTKMK